MPKLEQELRLERNLLAIQEAVGSSRWPKAKSWILRVHQPLTTHLPFSFHRANFEESWPPVEMERFWLRLLLGELSRLTSEL